MLPIAKHFLNKTAIFEEKFKKIIKYLKNYLEIDKLKESQYNLLKLNQFKKKLHMLKGKIQKNYINFKKF